MTRLGGVTPLNAAIKLSAAQFAIARRVGFAPPQYAYTAGPGTQNYLRGPLIPIRKLLDIKRRLLRRPGNLATLYCRMTRLA